ncbi:RNA-directed DNA polymerase, eukaryota [Tanacetum coccineum]
MDPKKAAKMFVTWQKWRASFVPQGFIPDSEVLDELGPRKVFLQGFSNDGHPLVVIFASKHYPAKDQHQFKKFVVHVLDKGIASGIKGTEIGNEKIVAILEMKDLSYKNVDTQGYISGFQFLQAYYPERLARLYILNMPRFFVSAWKMISYFIDKATLDKIVIVTNEEERRRFITEVGKEALPEEFGGEAKLVALQDVEVPQWAIEGDENSKFFHGIINRKRANLAIKGVMVDGEWVDDPCRVKEEFRLHFANRFRAPAANRCKLNYTFPNRLSSDQLDMLESPISRDEVRNAVWGCGENKSPGPDGFTFEFFRKFWDTLGSDFCAAVEWFFDHSSFSRGCNSSFIALIPKNHDPKFVNDYRPISLIGSLYKVVTKILATRLSSIISGLISDVQTAFLPNRQILDGPFIINELLSWCKHKKQQAMVFKVDFAKAYDSIRWDFLEDVLRAFGFGSKWCSLIQGVYTLVMAVGLLNDTSTVRNSNYCGFERKEILGPVLFILIIGVSHLWLSRAHRGGDFCTVADKLQFSVTSSLRRSARGGVESSQLALLQTYIEGTLLSNMEDRWVWDLNGEGFFRVKDVRILLDECFLSEAPYCYSMG